MTKVAAIVTAVQAALAALVWLGILERARCGERVRAVSGQPVAVSAL
jgi:branched-subunit amino acid ABC-type transport system permease component